MTDIVEQLRQVQGDNEDAREAADEIERLRSLADDMGHTNIEAADEIERLQDQIATLRELREYDRLKVERLSQIVDDAGRVKMADRAEIERLQTGWDLATKAVDTNESLRADNERLRAALAPFARNVDATSLREALAHICRQDLHDARAALEPMP